MPTYEYRCKKCGYEFEKFQQITAEPLKKCPKCGGHVERLISGGAGIIFKGSGFYETDYECKASESCHQIEHGHGEGCGCEHCHHNKK